MWRSAFVDRSEQLRALLAAAVRQVRRHRCILNRPASRPSFHAGETTPIPVIGLHVPNNRWLRGGAARTARSAPDWLSVDHRTRSAAFFLMTQQAALDASWMHLRRETLF